MNNIEKETKNAMATGRIIVEIPKWNAPDCVRHISSGPNKKRVTEIKREIPEIVAVLLSEQQFKALPPYSNVIE